MAIKTVVFDNQPITPLEGGGRIRLFGLYSGIKGDMTVTYVGTYDWYGKRKVEKQIADCLKEITVPLSGLHLSEYEKVMSKMPGKSVFDATFAEFAQYSYELLDEAISYIKDADIVIFSHPWMYSPLRNELSPKNQLIVYDSHNCEGYLRTKLLYDGNGFGSELARKVVAQEYDLCQDADVILACSEEDKDMFLELYNVDRSKIVLAPNGVFAQKIIPKSNKEKAIIKKQLKLPEYVAIFMGSDYQPNHEAAEYILSIAPRLPEVYFVIAGGVGNGIKKPDINNKYEGYSNNVRITGSIDEETKIKYYAASDVALNPIKSGSGTNIKMFEYMAAGIPIITSKTGARGIQDVKGNSYYLCTMDNIIEKITTLKQDKLFSQKLSSGGRELVCSSYSWENISCELGYKLSQALKSKKGFKRPRISVIIPTYERHDLLTKLMSGLNEQTNKDFEVIIIDQSSECWKERNDFCGMDICYCHVSFRGASKARNFGIRLSRGQIIAFIDDDCEPDINWLKNVVKYFNMSGVIGVEGRIETKHKNNKKYRNVSNAGLEGIAFMTANLFMDIKALGILGGFDEDFDNPHFREDTDLGWRARRLGLLPFANDVVVKHPPHKRSNNRESSEERNKFFINDPLLLKKHPDMYLDLFIKEEHYKYNTFFWDFFIQGLQHHNVDKQILKIFLLDPRVDINYIPKRIKDLIAN